MTRHFVWSPHRSSSICATRSSACRLPNEASRPEALGFEALHSGCADGVAGSVGVVCDCAGYIKGFAGKPVIQQALDMICDRTGRIMCFGMFEDRVTLDLGPLINRQPQVIGVMGMEFEDVTDSLAWMSSGRIDRESLITRRFDLAQASEAFEAQTRYAESGKVVLHPGK